MLNWNKKGNAAPKHHKASDYGYRHILEKIKRYFMMTSLLFDSNYCLLYTI
jgi:hypothetical protein